MIGNGLNAVGYIRKRVLRIGNGRDWSSTKHSRQKGASDIDW